MTESWTSLHLAARDGCLETVITQVTNGVDIDTKADDGNTPLLLAAKERHKEIVQLLINAGADIICPGWCNQTLLHYASENGWLEIVQAILKKDADVNTKTSCDETPLHLAAKKKHKEIVELLMNAGADIICPGWCNQTLLHFASKNGWLDIVQAILKKGTDVNTKTSCGETSLQMACEYSNFEIVEYLLNAGADVNVETDNGTSPLSTIIEMFCNITLGSPYYIKILPNFKLVSSSFITSGAYLKSVDYERIMNHLYLKEYILQDIELSSHAIINEFNYKHLPELYKHDMACKILPRIESMRIGNYSRVAHEVLQSVKHEMHVKGHCDVVGARPLVLKMLSVESCHNYCENIKKQSNVSNQRKRSAELDYDNQHTKSSHKMMRLN